MTNLSTTAVWEVLSNGGTMDNLLKDVPDEFYQKIQDYVFDLVVRHDNIMKDYMGYYSDINLKTQDRKSFAEEAKRYSHPSLLFGLLPEKEWQVLDQDKRDLAGIFFNGKLQKHTPYIDIRNLPLDEYK